MMLVKVKDFSLIRLDKYFTTISSLISMPMADTICQTSRMLRSCCSPWGEFLQKLKEVFCLF